MPRVAEFARSNLPVARRNDGLAPEKDYGRRGYGEGSMNILAINAYHANASAALVQNGQLIAAAEEERFNRVKYAAGFPVQAILYCLSEAGIGIENVHHVVVPRNPWARAWKKMVFAGL